MEATITISLKEYEKITLENESMKKILKEKNCIGLEFTSQNWGMGYIKNRWNIVNQNSLIKELINIIDQVREEKTIINLELQKLRFERDEKTKKRFIIF